MLDFLETEKINFKNLEKLQVAIEPNNKKYIIEKIYFQEILIMKLRNARFLRKILLVITLTF